MYRPEDETWIDAAWNKFSTQNIVFHFSTKDMIPLLQDLQTFYMIADPGLTINWDSRHRAVGKLSADSTQLPEFGWNNALVIKSAAPTRGAKPIHADVVACWLFEKKNDTPKATLTPVEEFVAELAQMFNQQLLHMELLKVTKLCLGTDVLPDLEKDARVITGIGQFRNDYLHDNLGQGQHLSDAAYSIKRVWTGAQVPQLSVFLVLGYCHMLQMDNLFNGAWGYDNDISDNSIKVGI